MEKKIRAEKPAHNTIGVRFLGKNVGRVFTYAIRRNVKVLLGQELVADTPIGPALCIVVRLDSVPRAPDPMWTEGLKFITRKTVKL